MPTSVAQQQCVHLAHFCHINCWTLEWFIDTRPTSSSQQQAFQSEIETLLSTGRFALVVVYSFRHVARDLYAARHFLNLIERYRSVLVLTEPDAIVATATQLQPIRAWLDSELDRQYRAEITRRIRTARQRRGDR